MQRSYIGSITRRPSSASRALVCACAVVGTLAIVDTARAVDATWIVTAGDYAIGSNWSTGSVPFDRDNVFINNGGTSTLSDSSNYSAGGLFVGDGAGNSGTFVQTSGTYNFSGTVDPEPQSPGVFIGANGGTGTYTMSGNALFIKNPRTNDTRVGSGPGGIGTMNVGGTATYTSNFGTFEVGRGLGANGTVNITDSGLIRTEFLTAFGQINGTGNLNISGNGIFRAEGGSVRVVADAGVAGTDTALPTTGNATISGNGQWVKGDTNDREFWVGQGRGAVGNMTLSDNALVDFDSWQVVARGPSTGIVVMNNSSIWRKRNTDGSRGGNFVVGDGGGGTSGTDAERQTLGLLSNGTLTLNNAAFVDSDNETWIGQFYATATVTMNGTSRMQSDNWYAIGRDRGIGNVTLNDDARITKVAAAGLGSGFFVLGSLGGNGTLTMNDNASVLSDTELWITEAGGPNGGGNGTNALVMNDASTFVTQGTNVNLGFSSNAALPGTASASITLNGTSRLTAGRIFRRPEYTGTRSLVFNGGGLIATRDQVDYIQLTDAEIDIQAGGATLDTNGFALTILPTLDGAGGLTKAGAGRLTVSRLALGGQIQATGGVLALAAPATAYDPAAASRVGAVAAGAGVIELSTSFLVVDSAGAATTDAIRAALLAGGIVAGGTTPSNQTVGYATATNVPDALQAALGADDTSVILRNTLKGDTNLDATVGFADLVTLAQNYNGPAGKTFDQGDFDYNGLVGFPDLVSLAQNYNLSLSAAQSQALDAIGGDGFGADFALAQSLVPEPTTLAGLAGVATLALRRRRDR